jgi:hypothetical protein
MYRIPADHQLFKVYWGRTGRMTSEETKLAHDVALLYGDCLEYLYGHKEIRPEQVAWYRWYSEEKVADPDRAKSEMPWTADLAFVASGSQFFASKDLTHHMRRIVGEVPPRYLRFEVQGRMTDSQIVEAPKRVCNLWIYAEPAPEKERPQYVLGADPAYGSSEWADGFCISVWRCWVDRIEQVAEFYSVDFLPYAFAWVMVYLCGLYGPCAWNLEITGPGAAVMGEIESLKRQRYQGSAQERKLMLNFMGGAQEYLYARFDSLNRNPVAKGTQSTFKEKNRYMDTFQGYFARGLAVPHSRGLLEEMRWIVREVGKAPSGSERHKDDRVIAAALAIQMWADKLRSKLFLSNTNFSAEQSAKAGKPRVVNIIDRIADRQRRLLGFPPASQ